MTTIDLRLKYQKEFGGSLNTMARHGDQDYMEWLEESLIQMFKVHKHLLDKSQPHLY